MLATRQYVSNNSEDHSTNDKDDEVDEGMSKKNGFAYRLVSETGENGKKSSKTEHNSSPYQ
jgi:hypothetical protein